MVRLPCLLLFVLASCSGSTESPPPDKGHPPDGASADLGRPREGAAGLEPLTVLVDHRLKDGPASPPEGPAPGCKPYCGTSSGQQAWFDGCTKQVLKLPGTNSPYYDSCSSCTPQCKFTGQPAEGWYSSCTSQLISQVDCG